MMDPILKENLLEGLQDVISNYNSGLDEETSIAKAASDRGFNKAQTERLVELYNTSRTLDHFDKHANDKAASFRLADKKGVLELLFDVSNDKMASELSGDPDLTSDYSGPETDFYGCKSAEEFPFDRPEKTASDFVDIGGNAYRMQIALGSLRKKAEHLSDESRIEGELAHSALSRLASRISGHYSAGDTEKLAAAIGVLAVPDNISVFRSVSAYLPSYVMQCTVKTAHVVDNRIVPEETALVSEIAGHLKKAEELEAEAAKLLGECKQASDQFDSKVRGFLSGGAQADEMDGFLADGPEFGTGVLPEKQAGFGAGVLAGTVFPNIAKATHELGSTAKAVNKEVDDANKRLVNTHREMILTDLINNDPYLREEDPETIAAYYSHFAELSPTLANNREVVRSVLRQAVHNGGGGYSPFDASSFLDAEKTLREVQGTLPPKQVLKELASDE